ncbi:MAG: hypothetical protein SH850_02340 [Planctomycetaceae bacterium]|nr:hypothetical protein [Planctomycetaceae bacterium]
MHHKIEELLDQIRTVRANKRSDVPQVGIAPIPTLTRDEFIAIEPTSEAPALRRTDAVATLTIEAVLELGGVDPKSVQWNTPVWLETATMTRGAGDTVHHVVNGVARIQRIDGPGKRPDTLQILITGPAAMLSEVQKAYGDQGVTVWLKKPTSKPQPPANVKPPAAAPEGSDVFGDAPQFRPQSVSHATFPQEDTLTIGAVLELSGIDPKAVQAGAGVWTDRVELPVTDAMKLRMGGRHLSSGMAMLKYVGGPGEQSGTLQVRIEGPVRELEALKRKANGQPVRVWLKRPLPVDNQPVGF